MAEGEREVSDLNQPITEIEYKLAIKVIERQFPNSKTVIEEYVKGLDNIAIEARHVMQLFFNRGGKLSAYCKTLKETLERYSK